MKLNFWQWLGVAMILGGGAVWVLNKFVFHWWQ
jgi:hypothetical protein